MNTFNYVEASPVMYSDPEGKIAIPIGYVLWGGAIISLEACSLTPQCKKTLIDGAQTASDAAHKGLKDLYDWCTNDNTQDEEGEKEKTEQSTATPSTPTPDPNSGCKEEWEAARARCSDYLTWKPKKRPPEIWGGSYDNCVKGQVSQRCGGNRVD